jgi:DNA-binding CsgD family transcriptional regulator
METAVMEREQPLANVMECEPAVRARSGNPYGLTRREMDVIARVLRAESNDRIAAQLSIAPSTVKHHLSHIFAKLGVMTRLQLAVFAVNNRLTGELAGPRM